MRRGFPRGNGQVGASPDVAGHVAVIGAGPAGLTAAHRLAKAGHPVTVYESSPFVGGLARSIELWDQIVDLGPHRFFSHDRRVNRLWLEIVGREFTEVRRGCPSSC